MGAGASNNNNQREVTHHLVVGISRSLYICSRLSMTNIHCLTVRFESAPPEMGIASDRGRRKALRHLTPAFVCQGEQINTFMEKIIWDCSHCGFYFSR